MQLNPWRPERNTFYLKHLGKLCEELNECGAAVSRCIIQGIEEREPVTRKLNREWLEDEIADVIANVVLVCRCFNLDVTRIFARAAKKISHLQAWHNMAGG